MNYSPEELFNLARRRSRSPAEASARVLVALLNCLSEAQREAIACELEPDALVRRKASQ